MEPQILSQENNFSQQGDGFLQKANRRSDAFRTLLRKEVADQIRSWRFIILIVLIGFVFIGTTYVSFSTIRSAVGNVQDPDRLFVYLKLLTISDDSLPTFHTFISFLGPLLGIALGFDAINAEQNSGTLFRLMAQPIYRDNILLAKFFASLTVVGVMFLSLAMLLVGAGMLKTGVMIEPSEILRILSFVVVSVVYVGFWLSLSICLSIRFRNAATSALTAIGIWLFFTVFYQLVVNVIVSSIAPRGYLSPDQLMTYQNLILSLMRLAPSQLYADASTTLLMPSIRSLGPLSMEQLAGAIPSPLSIRESMLIVWPQLTGLIAGTTIWFALSYFLFMRREIRS